MKRERSVAFVVARLGSQRLREKQLCPIGDRLLLDWVIDHLEQCHELDEIVLTTLKDPENDRLAEFADERGIGCYRYEGDVDNVTNRLRRAAEEFDADICVLVSADCPLVYAPGIDLLINELRSNPDADVTSHAAVPEGQVSLIQGIAVARRRCWQLADDISDREELRANQFPVIGQREELFEIHNFDPPEYFYGPKMRLSVDTYADLEFMTTIHDRLINDGRAFELPEVVELLAHEPQLLEINAHVRQRAPEDSLTSALFIVDAGPEFGQENLQRSLSLASQLIERMSCPVTFLIDDLEAKRKVEARGLRTAWGSLGRSPRQAPLGVENCSAKDAAVNRDLVVLDLGSERRLPAGWRAQFACRVAAIDGERTWAMEADELGATDTELLMSLVEGNPSSPDNRFRSAG